MKRRTALCRALGDPQRWLILEFLLQNKQACPVGELVGQLKIADATVSHHLQQLELAGLIRRQRRGRFIYCSAQIGSLRDLAQLFGQLSGQVFMVEAAEMPPQWGDASLVWS